MSSNDNTSVPSQASQSSPLPTDNAHTPQTPTLNTLLSRSAEGVPSTSGPPSHSTPQFASPQQSPVPRGPSRPESRDRYAATANAVAAGAGGHPRNPQLTGVQAQEWNQPRSPTSPVQQSGPFPGQETAPPPGAMPPGGPHPGYPGYPQQPPPGAPHPGYWQQQRPGMPHTGYPMPPGYGYAPPGSMHPPGPGFHPGYTGHPGMHPNMRPPHMQQGGDLVRMPPGPNPIEWAAMQRNRETNPDGAPAASPANPSGPDDERARLESPSWPNHGQHQQRGGPPGPPAAMMQQPQPAARREPSIVDRLVGPPNALNPPEVMPARRQFFERLVVFCERHGEPITMIPQVSKQNVDLHRLYIAVRNKGGFEQVTKDKAWKAICSEANPDISESSAAGYQLRRHYQKHLLLLECMETGRNADEAVAFADKLKKKKKDPGGGSTATPGGGGGQPQPTAAATPTSVPPGSAGAPSPFPGPPQGYYPPQAGQWPPQGGPPPGYLPPHAAYQGGPPPHMRPSQMDASQMTEEQRAAYARGEGQASTPYSQPPVTPVSQNAAESTSRAPSTGPPGASTPDSSSRLSAPDGTPTERPQSSASNAPPSHPPQTATPTPTGVPTPSTSMAAPAPSPAHPSTAPPYGQPPPMYASTGRPGGPPPQGGYPPYPPPPGAYPQGYPHPMSAHPQYIQHQQQMWHQQQQQAGRYPPSGPPQGSLPPNGGTPTQRGYFPQQGQPPRGLAPPQQQTPQSAPSPGGGQNATQRTNRPFPQPGATPSYPSMTPGALPQGQVTPIRAPPPTMAGTAPPPGPAGGMHGSLGQTSTMFPPGTVESTGMSQRRRRKVATRDLIGATPRRLLMTLRSGLDTEVVWALNALTVILHDENMAPPSLSQLPGLLNSLVEHLWATLAVVWPEEFKLDVSWMSNEELKNEESVGDEKRLCDAMKGSSDVVRSIVSSRKGSGDKNGQSNNYTKTTRTGRKVHLKEAQMPAELRKRLLADLDADEKEKSDSPSFSREENGPIGSIAERAYSRLMINLDAVRAQKSAKFNLREGIKVEMDFPEVKIEEKEEEMDEEEQSLNTCPLFYRLPNRMERAEYPNDVELESIRPAALIDKDSAFASITSRALCLSNIIRGFSFLHGNEHILAAQPALLRLLGKFLKLCVKERLVKRVKQPNPEEDGSSCTTPLVQKGTCVDPHDDRESLLQETASQLREDAFVIISHLSVVLDLFDRPGDISFGLLDGLVHWAISATAEATDCLLQGTISPRDYALESLCKLCVLERNVDLLLSTGPWPRIEKLVKVLSKLLPMSEEVHHREFAIVILNAMCLGSECVCWCAAMDTQAITHLINFIEAADVQMHTVMQTHGMGALRENPEMMGTSVGMLRRAASMLKMLTKVSKARKMYTKHQPRLLQFTMSQLMDSRVAGMVAESLYEMQRAEALVNGEGTSMGEGEEEREEEIQVKEEQYDDEDSTEKKVNGGHSPSPSADSQDTSSCGGKGCGENGVKSEGEEKEEESLPAPGRKRSAEENNGKNTKRSKVENGFSSSLESPPSRGEKRANGELSGHGKSLSISESRTENGSAMTAVA